MPISSRHLPALMLVVACLFWGMGFSWAKNAGDAVNRAAGRPESAAVGHVTQLAVRFSAATLVWVLVVPAVRRGWTWRTAAKGGVIGLSLAVGLVLQHVGLGLSDESLTAFLTSLAVVFVPLAVTLIGRRLPRTNVALAVPLAVVGMALMSGVRPGGLASVSAGAGWGVACAAAFSVEILLLDRLGRGESTAQLTLMLFAVSAAVCLSVAVCLPGFRDVPWRTFVRTGVLANLVPAVLLTTIGAFSLMTRFQPQVDPTRAAVIYLCEPLFAAAFAWAVNSRSMTAAALGGAALIVSANAVAEWRPRRV